MSNMYHMLHQIFGFIETVAWRDFLEIAFLTITIYSFLLWLKTDTQKNLTVGFYSYCALFCISYYADLTTMHMMLYCGAPIALLLFIVLHQDILQRNFVMLKKAKLYSELSMSWIDELMRSCLLALNNNKQFIVVIERNDNLKSILYAPCAFNADLKKDILDITLEKHICTNDYVVWVTQEGKLAAINASWKLNLEEEWLTSEAQALHKWKQDSIFVTSKTDAIIFKMNMLSRTFDLVMNGKIAEELSPEQVLSIVKRNLQPSKHKPFIPGKPLDTIVEKTL